MTRIVQSRALLLDDDGNVLGFYDPEQPGSQEQICIPIVSDQAPDDNDGRPDGTIYIQTGA